MLLPYSCTKYHIGSWKKYQLSLRQDAYPNCPSEKPEGGNTDRRPRSSPSTRLPARFVIGLYLFQIFLLGDYHLHQHQHHLQHDQLSNNDHITISMINSSSCKVIIIFTGITTVYHPSPSFHNPLLWVRQRHHFPGCLRSTQETHSLWLFGRWWPPQPEYFQPLFIPITAQPTKQ